MTDPVAVAARKRILREREAGAIAFPGPDLADEVRDFLTNRPMSPNRPTRHGHPLESVLASRVSPDALRASEEAVLEVASELGSFTDEQLVAAYEREIDRGTQPRQSASGIRSRRASLTYGACLIRRTGRRGVTAAGRACAIWEVARE